ncbi:MAG: tRNA pseudouridine(13) synthase TruD, partial [Syntrophobacterales bacterium]
MPDKFGRIYLTDDLPGIGGRIKDHPEDFVVEEIPLYDFSNRGNFAFLLLEKTNLSTLELVDLIRKQLNLGDEEVGLAGWKDKRAITRQWVSVPRDKVTERRLEQLAGDGIQTVEQRSHSHKL